MSVCVYVCVCERERERKRERERGHLADQMVVSISANTKYTTQICCPGAALHLELIFSIARIQCVDADTLCTHMFALLS